VNAAGSWSGHTDGDTLVVETVYGARAAISPGSLTGSFWTVSGSGSSTRRPKDAAGPPSVMWQAFVASHGHNSVRELDLRFEAGDIYST
jgi:hypothetical protein